VATPLGHSKLIYLHIWMSDSSSTSV